MKAEKLFQRRPKRGRWHLGVLGVLALLVFAFLLLRVSWLGSFSLYFFEPLLRMRAVVAGTTAPFFSWVTSHAELYTENVRLREEVARLQFAQSVTRIEHASPPPPMREGDILAPIVRRPPDTLYDTVIVGAGERDGVRLGNIVTLGDVALGTVVRVGRSTSLVALYSSPGEAHRVFLLSGTSTTLVRSIGLGQGAFSVSVPRTAPVSVGDVLYIYLESWHVFAHIVHVDADPVDALITAMARTPSNMWDIKFVTIRPNAYEDTE